MDILLSGLSTAGTGIIVVFVGLILLILSISVMALFRRRGQQPVAQETPAETPAAPAPQPPVNDDALIAVIVRDGQVYIPAGRDALREGDRVIVMVKGGGVERLDDILAEQS